MEVGLGRERLGVFHLLNILAILLLTSPTCGRAKDDQDLPNTPTTTTTTSTTTQSPFSLLLHNPPTHTCQQNCLDPSLTKELQKDCPQLNEHILLIHFLPAQNVSRGIQSREVKGMSTLEECTSKCCSLDTCNYAIFALNTSCYLFFCNKGPELCEPKKEGESPTQTDLRMTLVRYPETLQNPDSVTCETGLESQCAQNQVCIPRNSRSRNGHCACPEDLILNSKGVCVPIPDAASLQSPTRSVPALSTSSPMKVLEVSVGSQNTTLPLNEAFLYAYAVPQAPKDHAYSYEWTLISHPSQDPATLEGQTTETLHLSGLKQGSYMFQVAVRGLDSLGTANATLTVFPEKRVNQAPVAIISPSEQQIQLPTNSAVLDATASTDDDRIVSYKWEIQKYPIDYAALSTQQMLNSSTLQVKELIPGNYTFKLTVQDADHLTNSTTANVELKPRRDYPPTAIAGNDIVVYLPQTEVTLNGNASTDDNRIVQWEWKATGDLKKAVDMQDTHSAYLKLSGLEEGFYQFELTVTDEAGQVSTPSLVHVFVKQPTGNPPKASAGLAQTIALPQTWVLLDASESKADSKLVKWKWSQLIGPTNASIQPLSQLKANASGLTKGDYSFQVDIEDDASLSASASVNVTVLQRTNEPPKANAGDDLNLVLSLPLTLVQLSGLGSKDDVEVTEWKWEREPDSSAAGWILPPTQSSPNLQLAGLIPGKYVFKLTVRDEQGLSDQDLVTINVSQDPVEKDLVELILALPLQDLSETDKVKFLQQMDLLSHDTQILFHHLTAQPHSGLAVMVVYGKKRNGDVEDGLSVVKELRERLRQDVGLLAFPVLSLDTFLCLDPCSGHGVCTEFWTGRECVCHAFWMENYLKRHYGNRERNCDWSKIYVGVVSCFLLLMMSALVWSLLFLFRRNLAFLRHTLAAKMGGEVVNGHVRHSSSTRRLHPTPRNHYTLLGHDELEMEIRADEPESDDSDSEESLMFERGNGTSSRPRVSLHTGPFTTAPTTPGLGTTEGRNGILKKPRPGIKA